MLGMIVSAVSAVIPVVQGLATSIGKATVSAVIDTLKMAETYLPKLVEMVGEFAKHMGIFPDGVSVADIGRKAKMAEKRPEEFATQQDYLGYIQKSVQVDPEVVQKETEVDKYANLAIGAVLVMKTINEVRGEDIPLNTWVALAKTGINQPEAVALIDGFKGLYDQLDSYLEGKQSPEQELHTGDKIAEVYKEIYPELSASEIEAKVMQLELQEDKK